eukprot:gene36433-biopygen5312
MGISKLSVSSKPSREEVYVTTVEDTKQAFTKYEVERADRARELLSRLEFPSFRTLILNSGGIINCDITSSNVLRAEEIYRPPVASFKGKTVKNTADEKPVT